MNRPSSPGAQGDGERAAVRGRALIGPGAILAFVFLGSSGVAQEAAHAHVLLVMNPSAEVVEEAGLLTKALGDAGLANEHAGYAAGGVEGPGDLVSMQTHAAHVLHMLDPARIQDGPGFGFGVIPSAKAAIEHLELAAAAEGATENVRTHAEHVIACARNSLAIAERMLGVVDGIRTAESAEEAAPLADQLELLSRQLRNGVDGDGDGRIPWREGGLYQAQRHMELLLEGEGLLGR